MTELQKAIEAEIAGGWINSQRHPTLPLTIYKYSQATTFDFHWNDVTCKCRGLVLADDGEIVVNCMPKFHNHSEEIGQAIIESHKDSPYEVTIKMDGSLIQAALYRGQLVVTSSGSFGALQALTAFEWISNSLVYKIFEANKTYIFEIIYPQNRIVIDYKDMQCLTLLAIRNTLTGAEYDFPENIFERFGFFGVAHTDMSIEKIVVDLKRSDYINAEGFVVKYNDDVRLKFKYDGYCRLHKFISGVNEKWIWECLMNGINPEAELANIHDELFGFVKSTKKILLAEYEKINNETNSIFNSMLIMNFLTRKDQADWLLTKHKKYAHIIFGLLDKKNTSKMIWEMIKPVWSAPRIGIGEG